MTGWIHCGNESFEAKASLCVEVASELRELEGRSRQGEPVWQSPWLGFIVGGETMRSSLVPWGRFGIDQMKNDGGRNQMG